MTGRGVRLKRFEDTPQQPFVRYQNPAEWRLEDAVDLSKPMRAKDDHATLTIVTRNFLDQGRRTTIFWAHAPDGRDYILRPFCRDGVTLTIENVPEEGI